MKNLALFLCAGLLMFAACQNDEPALPVFENELRYDGPNVTGPVLPAGQHEAAVRFSADYLKNYEGREMEAVQFFLGQLPDGCQLNIYAGSTTDGRPETLIGSFDLSTQVQAPAWNRLPLPIPLVVGQDDLWLSIVLVHTQEQQSIGCDAGPNQIDGDWLLLSTDGQWLPYTERTPESINWNIRGELAQ